ncbi:MAG: lipid A biosynthesis acyltransferase [Gammaproteobacteria bacterium]|nr:lipid A biosynthesis acyltransferase [Gammaproteobacteria bacterium]
MRILLMRTVLRILAWWSLRALHVLGSVLGKALWLFPNRLRTVTEINLALCYPDKSAEWRREMGRASLIETGKLFCELGPLWRWPLERLDGLVVECSGWEYVEQALQEKRGLMVLLPHAGCWELWGLYVSQRMPITFMYRPSREPAVDPLLHEMRSRAGAKMVPTNRQGVRAMYKALSAGQAIGLLPDQEPRYGAGIFAPFFGMQAYTMVLPSRLAHKTSAAVVISCMERLPDGRGYHLHLLPLDATIYDEDPVVSASAANRGVEEIIALNPAQYIWSYKRFRRKPEGQTRGYRRS